MVMELNVKLNIGRIKESTGEKQASSYLMQTIGIAIQQGNSRCILSTVKDSRKMGNGEWKKG